MDFVEKVKQFNEISGTKEEFDVRKTALYIGLQLEEMREKIESLLPPHNDYSNDIEDIVDLVRTIKETEKYFKGGDYDYLVENIDRCKALDADVDLAVVALGGAIAVGGDVCGACHHVADNNLTKFPIINGVRAILRDKNGKIMKPENYVSADLKPYLRG